MAFNPYSLEGKTVLVTGASSGIGKATAIACSRLGAHVIVSGRNSERLQETFSELDGEGHLQIIADLTDEDQIALLAEFVPPLDGFVNNAGVGNKIPINFIKRVTLQNILDVNTIAPILLSRYLLKKKKLKRGASMVITSSIAGVCSVDIGNTLYSVSKSAVDGFMKNAAKELAEKGIRVNSVNPGMVDTPINDYIVHFCETGIFCDRQDDFVFVVSKYNFLLSQTKETGQLPLFSWHFVCAGGSKKAPLNEGGGAAHREGGRSHSPFTTCSAAARRYSEGVLPVMRLNTFVK